MNAVTTTPVAAGTLVAGDELALAALRARLAALLGSRLDAAAAELFAEPVVAADRGSIVWRTALEGAPQPLRDAAGPQADEARVKLHDARTVLHKIAAELRSSRDTNDVALLRVIDAALEPTEDNVFVVGSRPVLVGWGLRTAAARTPAAISTGRVSSYTPSLPSASAGAAPLAAGAGGTLAARRSRVGLVGWALAAAVLLGLALLLARWNAGALTFWDDKDDLSAGLAEEARLRRELADLRKTLDEARLGCDACAAPESVAETPAAPAPAIAEDDVCERVSRELGGCDSGALSISLAWNALHDLDLGVETPSGQLIYHAERSRDGGTLTLDFNVQPEERVNDPVEVVSWAGAPPPGRYRIYVNLYDVDPRQPGNAPIPFTIRYMLGDRTETITGSVLPSEEGRWKLVHEFVVP